MRISVFFKTFLLLLKYSFLPLQPTPQPPSLPHLPPLFPPTPLVTVHVSFMIVPANFILFPHCPLPSPLWSLSACSQFQCLWLYSACLFVMLIRFLLKVRSYGICFTAWLISLSIMLSSSIHAVTKGRSSFFLFAA